MRSTNAFYIYEHGTTTNCNQIVATNHFCETEIVLNSSHVYFSPPDMDTTACVLIPGSMSYTFCLLSKLFLSFLSFPMHVSLGPRVCLKR